MSAQKKIACRPGLGGRTWILHPPVPYVDKNGNLRGVTNKVFLKSTGVCRAAGVNNLDATVPGLCRTPEEMDALNNTLVGTLPQTTFIMDRNILWLEQAGYEVRPE